MLVSTYATEEQEGFTFYAPPHYICTLYVHGKHTYNKNINVTYSMSTKENMLFAKFSFLHMMRLCS